MAEGIRSAITGLQIEDMDMTPPEPKISWETVDDMMLVLPDDARDLQMLEATIFPAPHYAAFMGLWSN